MLLINNAGINILLLNATALVQISARIAALGPAIGVRIYTQYCKHQP